MALTSTRSLLPLTLRQEYQYRTAMLSGSFSWLAQEIPHSATEREKPPMALSRLKNLF